MTRSICTLIALSLSLLTIHQADAKQARGDLSKDLTLDAEYTAPWLAVAKQYVGSGPQALGVRHSLWCAAGLNKFLERAGYVGTGSDLANSFSDWGYASPIRPGAIVVLPHHVGIVVADKGEQINVLSANHSGGKVAFGLYHKSRIKAVRWPSEPRVTQVASSN